MSGAQWAAWRAQSGVRVPTGEMRRGYRWDEEGRRPAWSDADAEDVEAQ